jgi:hypothetical protein
MKIKLNCVRLSFAQLFEAKTVNGEGKAAFSASFLISPNDPQVAVINAAIDAVGKDKWGAKGETNVKAMRAADKVCLHNGDLKANYEGFEGMLFISSRNPLRPLVIDTDRTPLVEADGKPYSGCFVNASIELWAQDNNYGKRINATLLGVQFFKDGESFSGGAIASVDDFDDLSLADLI